MHKLFTATALAASIGTLSYVVAAPTEAKPEAPTASQLKTVTPASFDEQLVEYYVKQRAGKHYRKLTLEQRTALAQEFLDFKLLADYADENNIVDDTSKIAIMYGTVQIKSQSAMRHYLQTNPITDAEVKAQYEKVKGGFVRDHYEASHILVEKEETAKQLIAAIAAGETFEDLAKKNSVDTESGDKGGALGSFTLDEMTPEFGAAIKKMKAGEISKTPAKTPFGWHVFKLTAVKAGDPPSIEILTPSIKKELGDKKLRAWIETRRKAAQNK